MFDSLPTAQTARFERVGVVADPRTAARTRDEFSNWLEQVFALGSDQVADLVLATYEALANSAEFAYPTQGEMGTMDVRAAYHPLETDLIVTVADRGQWRTAAPDHGDRSRGRGIALMRTLADRASIQTSTRGTTVQLAWTGVSPR